MPARVRVKLNKPGFRAVLNSPDVMDMLRQHGEDVAAKAASGMKERATGMRNPDYVVRVEPGDIRARCFVWAANTNSFLAEAHDRALSKALG